MEGERLTKRTNPIGVEGRKTIKKRKSATKIGGLCKESFGRIGRRVVTDKEIQG